MSTDNDGSEQSFEVPEEYADVDPTLIPLFEQPREWFQEPICQYETALGPFGDVVDLSPEAVVFMFSARRDQYDVDGLELQQQVAEHKNTVYVANENTAENQSNPVAWIDFGNPLFFYYERVPFEGRVTTPEELREELSNVMHAEPEWGELFEEAETVATSDF